MDWEGATSAAGPVPERGASPGSPASQAPSPGGLRVCCALLAPEAVFLGAGRARQVQHRGLCHPVVQVRGTEGLVSACSL